MGHIHDDKLKELETIATEIREDVIRMISAAGSGHPAGSLGMADVFTALYFHVLNHDPKNPDWEERDRLILSNGHICPVRYAAMARAGYFPPEELMTLRKLGSRLQGHPERSRMPALESTSGPLGAGLAQGCGLAYAARLDGRKWQTYVVASDGEHGAGLHWEAVMFAGKSRLAGLTCIVDRNGIQIDGRTEDVMPLEPLKEKYEAFNWRVIEADGNDILGFIEATDAVKEVNDRPTVIIARNVPGSGVSFMEGKFEWHGKAPNAEEAAKALEELAAVKARLAAGHD